MKKILLGLCLLAVAAGCDNSKQQNKLNKEEQYKATIAAENSPTTVSELPFNLRFNMNKAQVDSALSISVKSKTISNYEDMYYYDCKLKSGKTIKTNLGFGFHNDSLYSVVFSIDDLGLTIDERLFREIEAEISDKLGDNYKRISYYEGEGNKKMIFTKWFKGNQYIFLRKAIFNDISIVNAPIAKIISDAKTEELLNNTPQGNAKVENSSWDGSVSQVKKYLKSTLKDPDSYKSVEWGNVVKTNNGYMVRHKYKAKNSFGGYVMENNVFYLDFSGNVTSVAPFK